MSEITLRENSQEALLFTLRNAGADYDPSGLTVRMMRRTKKGVEDIISTADGAPILTITAEGLVRLDPADDTWLGATSGWRYDVYFSVEASGGVWISYPEDSNIKVIIIP